MAIAAGGNAIHQVRATRDQILVLRGGHLDRHRGQSRGRAQQKERSWFHWSLRLLIKFGRKRTPLHAPGGSARSVQTQMIEPHLPSPVRGPHCTLLKIAGPAQWV